MTQRRVDVTLDRTSPARELVHLRLGTLQAALLGHTADAGAGVPDAVHQSRVTCRRLRAALGTFGPLLERGQAEAVRGELRWAARSLGEARDLEVVRARLTDLVDHPDMILVGPVRRRMEELFAARARAADAHVAKTLGSDRYRRLLASLHRLVDDPAWSAPSHRDVATIVPPLVRRDVARMERRGARAAGAQIPRDLALHELRKAAKRVRYAGEAVEPVWGVEATAMVELMTLVTKTLGDRQDAVISRRVIDHLAEEAATAGESVATHELLRTAEETRARECERAFEQAWGAAVRPEAWLWLA